MQTNSGELNVIQQPKKTIYMDMPVGSWNKTTVYGNFNLATLRTLLSYDISLQMKNSAWHLHSIFLKK